MSRYEYIAPCHFGLEAVLKREITDLGYEIVSVEDGRVIFAGDETGLQKLRQLRVNYLVLPTFNLL